MQGTFVFWTDIHVPSLLSGSRQSLPVPVVLPGRVYGTSWSQAPQFEGGVGAFRTPWEIFRGLGVFNTPTTCYTLRTLHKFLQVSRDPQSTSVTTHPPGNVR